MKSNWTYKPGDNVKVRDDLDRNKAYRMLSGPCENSEISPNSKMEALRGKVVTIRGYTGGCRYYIKEDCGNGFWADEMFESDDGQCICTSLL